MRERNFKRLSALSKDEFWNRLMKGGDLTSDVFDTEVFYKLEGIEIEGVLVEDFEINFNDNGLLAGMTLNKGGKYTEVETKISSDGWNRIMKQMKSSLYDLTDEQVELDLQEGYVERDDDAFSVVFEYGGMSGDYDNAGVHRYEYNMDCGVNVNINDGSCEVSVDVEFKGWGKGYDGSEEFSDDIDGWNELKDWTYGMYLEAVGE